MKTRKILALLTACVLLLGVLAACGGGDSGSPSPSTSPSTGGSVSPSEQPTPPPETGELDAAFLEANGLEYDVENDTYKFTTTRKITVEVFDRGTADGKTPSDNNAWTDWIKAGVLRDHNIEVTFVPVDRFSENDRINDLLAGGEAPDVSYTYNNGAVQTYADMGGILDLSAYVNDNTPLTRALWNYLDTPYLWSTKDPDTGTIWWIEGVRNEPAKTNTFIRQDWLDKLGLKAPTTQAEFHDVLVKFKENAETLLGADANMIVPFSVNADVAWSADALGYSFVPSNLSDKDAYINGFDDRHVLYPDAEGNVGGAWKKAIGVLNEWYNEGLLWKDFALYKAGDTNSPEDSYLKNGYVGAFIQSWDYPYRDGETGITGMLHTQVSPDANFVAIETFPNDAGAYRKDLLSTPTDRKIYFPATNKEPLASIIYVNWITRLENIAYLQMGDEGRTHKKNADGSISLLTADDPGYDPLWIQNAANNIDYTMTNNGINYNDLTLTGLSLANSKAPADPQIVAAAYTTALHDAKPATQVNVGQIVSESGMSSALSDKRNVFLANAIIAAPGQWEAVYDNGLKDYLQSGGQDIINERASKWTQYYGDATSIS
ncbi:hypothetical protein FACS18949_10280 [Clostridia bacterium]|nr:hypothetical protein FACS18949_10280 [Clostridia bacterium]